MLADVFITHVVAADERFDPVDDDDLAMVSKVDPQRIAPPGRGLERGHFRAGVAEILEVFFRQTVTPQGVVKDIDPHPCGRFGHQSVFDTLAQFIGTEDVELKQDVLLSPLNALDDGIEGRLSVDEQIDVVLTRQWEQRQVLQQLQLTALPFCFRFEQHALLSHGADDFGLGVTLLQRSPMTQQFVAVKP